jgi:hypothetical protein
MDTGLPLQLEPVVINAHPATIAVLEQVFRTRHFHAQSVITVLSSHMEVALLAQWVPTCRTQEHR